MSFLEVPEQKHVGGMEVSVRYIRVLRYIRGISHFSSPPGLCREVWDVKGRLRCPRQDTRPTPSEKEVRGLTEDQETGSVKCRSHYE